MSNIPEDTKEKAEMDQLISDATRPSKNSAATLSLSTEIIIGLYSSSPLQKIRHILEAYQTLTREDKEKIIPKESNRKYMVKMRELCYSFMDMFDLPPLPYQFHNRKGLTFSFSADLAYLYLAPFVGDFYFYGEWTEENKKAIEDVMNKFWQEGANLELMNEYEIKVIKILFRHLVKNLEFGVNAEEALKFKNQYVDFMIPWVSYIATKIQKELIDGTTWEKAAAIYNQGKQK